MSSPWYKRDVQADARKNTLAKLQEDAAKTKTKPVNALMFLKLWAAELTARYGFDCIASPLTVKEKAQLNAKVKVFTYQALTEFVRVVVGNWRYFKTRAITENPNIQWRKKISDVPNIADFITMFDVLLDSWNEAKAASYTQNNDTKGQG